MEGRVDRGRCLLRVSTVAALTWEVTHHQVENLCLLESRGFDKLPSIPPFRISYALASNDLETLQSYQSFTPMSLAFPQKDITET